MPLLCSSGAKAQNAAPALALNANGFSWDSDIQGAFVASMASETNGVIWFGTEDYGVYRYDPRVPYSGSFLSGRWTNFSQQEGLGDNSAYAIAIDRQGRVWAGTQSHGVSVFNGKEWRSYDVLSGPLGERVFDIAISPLDGDVWIATNRGLTRYSVSKDTWRNFTRAEGLPSDQIETIAFAKDGTLFVGTQCDGLAVGKVADDYAAWKHIEGVDGMTNAARGEGLPSNLINDILVGKDGTVYVATNSGLGRSQDGGESWLYLRGRNYAQNIKGQYPRIGIKNLRVVRDEGMDDEERKNLLLEDYVTTLAEDGAGRIWLGHPRTGVESRTPGAEELAAGGVVETPSAWRVYQAFKGRQLPDKWDQEERSDFVTSILTLPDQPPLVAAYGSGAIQLQGGFFEDSTQRERQSNATETSEPQTLVFPSVASPLTAKELNLITEKVKDFNQPLSGMAGAFLGDDWITVGDWVGRYGINYAMLCAMQSPLDHEVINDTRYRVKGRVGPNPFINPRPVPDTPPEGEGLRHWVHRERWNDARVLYNPIIGYRRQADWDDHGETYPWSYEGPDVWAGVRVPAGTHRVALYFFNKDGHDQANRVRDYVVEIKKGHENILVADNEPVLARARVRDFWGGVYKIFTVQGPGDYFFIIRKNNTFNTIVQAILIDKVAGATLDDPKNYTAWLGSVSYQAPPSEKMSELSKTALEVVSIEKKADLTAAIKLWVALDGSYDKTGAEVWQQPGRVLAYRAAQSAVGEQREGKLLLQAWRWTLPLWPQSDRQQFADYMKKAHDSLVDENKPQKDGKLPE